MVLNSIKLNELLDLYIYVLEFKFKKLFELLKHHQEVAWLVHTLLASGNHILIP